jgi:hypothetical protein
MDGDAQVWPGIELDVVDDGARGHLLVIVSPDKAREFSGVVDEITDGATPDKFETTIEEVLEQFDELGPLYVAHYKQKKPNLSDEALEKLIAGSKNPGLVIKEVANSISAGIYISHGHASIYGSDICSHGVGEWRGDAAIRFAEAGAGAASVRRIRRVNEWRGAH